MWGRDDEVVDAPFCMSEIKEQSRPGYIRNRLIRKSQPRGFTSFTGSPL